MTSYWFQLSLGPLTLISVLGRAVAEDLIGFDNRHGNRLNRW